VAARTARKGRTGRVPFRVRLSENMEKSLTAYCAAAAAAGVSLLALVPAAEAKIIYTPTHIKIPVNGGPVSIDLDNDGDKDFSFVNSQTFYAVSDPCWLQVNGAQSKNLIWGRGSNTFHSHPGVFASALRKGFTIGSNNTYFQGKQAIMANMGVTWPTFSAFVTFGQWLNAASRYLGLKFMISGQAHYGWARVAVTFSILQIQATITGYAYETIPNKPIIAGKTKGPDVITVQPGSLGRLALGRK